MNKSFQNTTVTDDVLKDATITPAVQKKIEWCGELVAEAPKKAEKEILKAIEMFPDVPMFYNFLAVSQIKQGKKKAMEKTLERTIEKFPDYLFGRLNKVNILLQEDEIDFEKAYTLLRGKFPAIARLYPRRDKFHISEIYNYYHTFISTLIADKRIDDAEAALKEVFELRDMDEDAFGNQFDGLAQGVSIGRIIKFASNIQEEGEAFNKVDGQDVSQYEQSSTAPILENEALKWMLTTPTDEVNGEVLNGVLSLPFETIKADLLLLAQDFFHRYEYLYELGWDEDSMNASLHALFFLAYYEDKEGLEVFLEHLRREYEFQEFFFSEDIQYFLLRPLYFWTHQYSDDLLQFLREPNVYFGSKALILEGLTQKALKDDVFKDKFIADIVDLIHFLLDNKSDEALFDNYFLSELLMLLNDFSVMEALPLVERIYDEGHVVTSLIGKKEQFCDNFGKEENIHLRRRVFESDIFSFYKGKTTSTPLYEKDEAYFSKLDDRMNDPFEKYLMSRLPMDGLLGEKEEDFGDEEYIDYWDEEREEHEPIETFKREGKKVGRNDPCPCGSGKKYKKCCWKKER